MEEKKRVGTGQARIALLFAEEWRKEGI